MSNLAQLANACADLDLFQAPLEAAGEFYSSFVQYSVHLSVLLEAEIPVAGGASSAPQASKLSLTRSSFTFFHNFEASKVQWPGSYYTCDIATGFEKMDIMRGGMESKSRRKGNTLRDRLMLLFRKSTM